MRPSTVALLCAVFALVIGYALQLWERVERQAEDDEIRAWERERMARERGEAIGYAMGKQVGELAADALGSRPLGIPAGMVQVGAATPALSEERRPMPVPSPGHPVA